jgi:hypothetical protein
MAVSAADVPTGACVLAPLTAIAVMVGAGGDTVTRVEPVTPWYVARRSTGPTLRKLTAPAAETEAIV